MNQIFDVLLSRPEEYITYKRQRITDFREGVVRLEKALKKEKGETITSRAQIGVYEIRIEDLTKDIE